MQHGDPERFFRYCGFGSSFAWNTQNSNINMGTTKWNEGGELASNPAIEIPVTNPTAPITVTHNPSAGVYTNGGLLYAYDKSGEFGFFIVRKDGKIDIPFAHDKGTYTGIGDAWLSATQTRGSHAPHAADHGEPGRPHGGGEARSRRSRTSSRPRRARRSSSSR